MHRLPLAIIAFLWLVGLVAQSPHGPGLTISCEQCHSPSGWSIDYNALRFNHDRKTDFALEGAHELTSCTSCHQDLSFKGAPEDCASCHTDLHNQTVGNDCARCHTSQSWLVAEIPEIHEQNGFALTGSHSNLSCTECHTDANPLNFFPVGNDCYSCHSDDYASTESPNHQQAGYSLDCTECHTPLGFGWDSENINHDFFPLTQGHDIADCTRCHTTGNYADASPDCVSCHQQDYLATQDPNHQAAGFSTDCINCHTIAPDWTPAAINHDFFPLTQGHDISDCARCHTTGNYGDTSPDCVSCHQQDYLATQDPNHQVSGFSTDCTRCHTTAPGWTPADINHDFFPLTQGHNLQDCMQCHTSGNYADASPDCVSCHQTDYDGTQDPNHQSAGFSTDCATCHTTAPGWTPATVNHDFFPLTQGHNLQDCTQCHTSGNYADASPECVSCHQADYNATQNPNHQSAGFSNDCASCHTTAPGWTPATVDHDFFPLTLGHNIQDCTRCHTTGNYADASAECVSCHQTDYNQTSNPNHQAANFPTDCVACHTTNPGWTPVNWDHDSQYFPIYSGRHRGEWSSCTECHTNPNDFAVFSCFSCHGQTKTDEQHQDVNGYTYDSMACLECHPDGTKP